MNWGQAPLRPHNLSQYRYPREEQQETMKTKEGESQLENREERSGSQLELVSRGRNPAIPTEPRYVRTLIL